MLETVNAYLTAFSGYAQEAIFEGYQNNCSLYNTQGYIVYTVEDTSRVGMNISDHSDSANSIFTTKMLREYIVSIDFCGTDESIARAGANAIEIISNCDIGQQFFKDKDVMLNYADDIAYLPFTDLDTEYVHRYRVNLNLTKWETVSISQEYAEKIKFSRVENIDSHHKP